MALQGLARAVQLACIVSLDTANFSIFVTCELVRYGDHH